MSEHKGVMTEELTDSTAAEDGITQDINTMIADLLKNVFDDMQSAEMNRQSGDASLEGTPGGQTAMDLETIKSITSGMQKFLDNANVLIAQLESGTTDFGHGNDSFFDSYIATADSILEVAAFSTKDSVTGLSNKYGFDNRLVLEWNRAAREQTPLSLLIFELDGFNPVGSDMPAEKAQKRKDDIFKEVAAVLVRTVKRSTDFIARWSDDEFAALLPITDKDGAMIVANRIRTEAENMVITEASVSGGQIFVNIGVNVHTPDPSEQSAGYVAKAQDALSRAKAAGCNQIVLA